MLDNSDKAKAWSTLMNSEAGKLFLGTPGQMAHDLLEESGPARLAELASEPQGSIAVDFHSE